VVFQVAEGFADGVAHVEQHILEVVDILDHLGELLGVLLLARGGVALRLDAPVEAEDGAFALGKLGEDVAVLLLHILEQFALRTDVAVLGLLQDEAAAKQMRKRAEATVASMGGALPRTLEAIETYLPSKADLKHAS